MATSVAVRHVLRRAGAQLSTGAARTHPSVVLGTMTFGWNQSSTEVTQEVAEKMIETYQNATNNNELDTAHIYGGGSSESMLGVWLAALRERGVAEPRISSKAQYVHKYGAGSHGGASGKELQSAGFGFPGLRSQLDLSLERLQSDSMHIFYLHQPDLGCSLEETLAACQMLYEQGKFKELAMSNYHAEEVREAVELCRSRGWVAPTVYQGMYSGIARLVEGELLPTLKELGVRFLAYNPLAAGMLTGKHIDNATGGGSERGRFYKNPNYINRFWKDDTMGSLKELRDVCTEHDTTMVEAAYRWLTCHSMLDGSVGDGVLIGASSQHQLEENLRLVLDEKPLPSAIVEAMDQAWIGHEPHCMKYYRGRSNAPGSVDE